MNFISRGSRAPAAALGEVGLEQRDLARLAELVVDREVGEVEVAIAHPGVLPIDDPERFSPRMKFAASRSL